MENESIILEKKEQIYKKKFNNRKSKKKGKALKYKFKSLFESKSNEIDEQIIKENITNNNEVGKQKIKKVRNPGIDLIRLFVQYTIIFNHMVFANNTLNRFSKHKRKILLLHSFTDWNNDVFILISGIVGYKTNKYSNLSYLWLTVFFYSVGIHKYIIYFKKNFTTKNQYMSQEYCPVIFNRYWYFTTYFGMYLFLPVINKGIANLTKGEFKLVVISTLGILVFWREYKNPNNDIFHLNKGFSLIWFLIYYLTGAYIGKYRVDYTGIKKYIFCLAYLSIFTFASFLYYRMVNNELYIIKGNKKINLPTSLKQMLSVHSDAILKITQSITACLFCMQIHYNKYLAKIICFFGPLAFSVYLIHINLLILENVLKHILDDLPNNISLNLLLSSMLGRAFKIFITCLIIDYFRYLLFTILRIRKILIFLEIKMKEFIK